LERPRRRSILAQELVYRHNAFMFDAVWVYSSLLNMQSAIIFLD